LYNFSPDSDYKLFNNLFKNPLFLGQLSLFKTYFCDYNISVDNITQSKEYFNNATDLLKIKAKIDGKN